MTALGYYVPGEQDHIDIQFLPRLEGYIWVFPRCGHLSVGICGKGEPAQRSAAAAGAYMKERGISWKGSAFYSHMLPSLDCTPGGTIACAGDGWMAVGDAAGLVDPITGEGLYYAIRSADLAARALLSEAQCRRGKAGALSAAAAPRFRGRSGIRLASGQARFPGPVPLRFGACAHGAVYAPQSTIFGCDAGSVRRHAAVPGLEAALAG